MKIFWQILLGVAGAAVGAGIAAFLGATLVVIGACAAAGGLISALTTLINEYFSSSERAEANERIATMERAASAIEQISARRDALLQEKELAVAAMEGRFAVQKQQLDKLNEIHEALIILRKNEQDAMVVLRVNNQELERLRNQARGDISELRERADEDIVTLPEAALMLKKIEADLAKPLSFKMG